MDLFFNDTEGTTENIQEDNLTSTTDEIERLLENYNEFIKNKDRKPDNKTNLIKQTEIPNSKEMVVKTVLKNLDTEDLPACSLSKREKKKLRQVEKDKSKGSKWYNLPATEVTEEVKADLEVLKMRSVLDPKQFYKKNDLKVLPKYFQIGKVVDSPLDYYSNRLTKKERKRTLVDELLADAEFNRYNKKKYKEIIEEKQKTNYKYYKQSKKNKNKK